MEKVYLTCNESDIFYRFQNYKFYFSSVARRERFIQKLDSYVKEESFKLINKYNINIDEESFNIMFAFVLYNKLEKRGFKVERNVDSHKVKDILEMPIFRIWGDYID